MRFLQLLIAVLIIGGFCSEGTAGNAKSSKIPMTFEEYLLAVRKIDRFKTICDQPDVYILDLREEVSYKAGHIKRALHMGADIKEERLNQLVPDKKATVVIYCFNSLGIGQTRAIALTYTALPQIIALGYANVFLLENGWNDSTGKFDRTKCERIAKSPLWESH